MKSTLKFLIPLILLPGCVPQNTIEYEHNPNAIKYGFHLDELSEGKYNLAFLGNPGSSLEYAQETWDRRAGDLCAPLTYTATYTLNQMVNGTDKYPHSGLIDDNAAVGLCIAGGAIGCMLASIFSSEGSYDKNVEYPAIEGKVTCDKE